MFRTGWQRPALLATLGVLASAAALLYHFLFADLPAPGQPGVELGAPTPSILFTDRSARVLYEAIAPDGNKHVPLPLNAIPVTCRQATLATEDSRFYSHPGIDPLAIARAAWRNWRGEGPFSGASTLSQQLARSLYLSADERGERTLQRKLREAWLAWRLERIHSKDELLALYLNTSYYGHFAVGIEAAAQSYFGMHARELDLAQCALLAGLLQYPAGYNPLEYPTAARGRQATVLGLMVRDGYIAPEAAQEALNERLAFASTPFPIEAPHFVMWVQGLLETLLGTERVRAGGLRVITTLDLDWQTQAEAVVERRLAALRPCAAGADPATCDRQADPARRIENAGLIALDPASGAVLAMVGNVDYFDRSISGAVNTTLASRQPGSAIKPLTYALALDPARAAAAGDAPWTAATLIADLRTVFPTDEGLPYVPQNYDLAYHGPVSVRAALASSYNIPAVKTLEHVGVDALIELANKLGIPWEQGAGSGEPGAGLPIAGSTQPHPVTPTQAPAPGDRVRYGLALTLGGGEVRLLDLTAAYAAFAAGGQRVVPFAIARVETLDGEVLYDQASKVEKLKVEGSPTSPFQPSTLHLQRVLDPRVAYLITDILSDAHARQPGFGASSALDIGRPAAAKTGTTTDWRDNWTIGYTPDLVVGVWVGNADNTPMAGVSGVTGAAPIWHDFTSTVLRGASALSFSRPDGLVNIEVCADSGLLPEARARDAASATPQRPTRTTQYEVIACPQRRYEWFIAGTEPTEVDTSHVRVAVDVRTGEPATRATPQEVVTHQSFWLLPTEYREWARAQGIAQPQMVEGDGSKVEGPANALQPATLNLELTSPDPMRSYHLDPGLPADVQRVPVTARPSAEIASRDAPVTLLLDGAPLATVGGPDYTVWWPLARGRHTFQAVVTADGRTVSSEPVVVFVE